MTSLLRQDDLLCLFLLFAGSFGLPHMLCPTNRYDADDINRGDNYVDDEHVVYTLDLLKARKIYTPHETYSIRVNSNSPDNKFNDVHVSLEARDERCGAGQFILNKNLYQPSGCYNIVSTQRKEPMGKATFKWKAPLCGCVTIRAVVHSATGEYFLDDDTEYRGSLVKTVCPQAKDTDNTKDDDDEETGTNTSLYVVEPAYDGKVEFLCRANEKVGGAELLVTDYFKIRRNIVLLNLRQVEDLEDALEQRRNDILVCCRKS
ncbi:hypothetical protein CHS0354_018830 [Potamilus streckersoni]|uniref:Reelin domain-containing protein n=1 Tax=Potamilus streckersoni TaxID=2493646 RepID=A0AAE0VVJ2_9BIVA|nr:hypothetical protein CHS0354_018830 [Potamilus streckersoni]